MIKLILTINKLPVCALMEIPDNFVQQWMIIVMGKRDKISGNQIYLEVKKEK
jgi:hypothetical protein